MLQGTPCFICPDTVPGPSALVQRPRLTHDDIRKNASYARQELCKRKLSHFVKQAWHVNESVELEWSWHIECIADHVQWMLEQWMGRREHTVENMVINVPPGSMKSLILNVFAPAWMWLPSNDPSWTLLTISNSEGIVLRDAAKTKEILKSDWYIDNFLRRSDNAVAWSIRKDADSMLSYKNTAKGWRKSQSQASKIVGHRFDAIFLDDPNDTKDISEVKLQAVKNTWYAAGNRLNDMRVAIRIMIQQRIHEDDLTGTILEDRAKKKGTKAKKTEHLCIPMEYTTAKCACGDLNCDTSLGKNDPRTEEGEVLHPERNPPYVLDAEKIRLGPLGTAGQLMQRPAPLGGGMFKHNYWGYFDTLPRDRPGRLIIDDMIMSVDSTFGGVDARTGKAKGSSRVCLLVMASKGSTRYVCDVVVAKMSFADTKDAIRRLYKKWTDDFTGHAMIRKLIIENKANGPAIISDLTTEIPGIIEDNPDGDKMSRANAAHPTVAAGNVRIMRDQPWTDEFKHELGVFPNGKYDDQLDAFTQAINHMASSSGLARTLALCKA